ncbi:MAG TPA: DUF4377 domain-containing protein [Lutibacter sp.]
MRVNHFQQTATGEGQTLVYLVQEGSDIGTEKWNNFYSNIEGFEYELGYVYDLIVEKQAIKNPPADGSSINYGLIEIISKEKIEDNVSFEVILKSTKRSDPPSFVTGNKVSGFKILNTIEIDCSDLCDQMVQMLETENELLGLFKHTETDAIKLIELKME